MAKKNPSVDVATRASQALQAGVAPAMLHRHIGVHPTYADRREATVQPSGRHVTVHEFGLPRGAHSALAVVTGQRAGEYEVFLVRDGERELPVAGGKVSLSGSGVARRNRGAARRNPLPDWPGAAGAYKRSLAALEKWNASEAAAQRRAHRGAKSTFRYSPPDDIRQWTKALDDGDEEMIKYFLTVREPDWNASARANPRFKHLSDEADALIDADVARIKSGTPDVAACLSDAGAWGHVFQVLTYLRGHGMDMTAASFRDAVMRRDLHGIHLDDRILGAGSVGKNAYNRTSGAQAAKAFLALRKLCQRARANGGMAPFSGDMGFGRTRSNPTDAEKKRALGVLYNGLLAQDLVVGSREGGQRLDVKTEIGRPAFQVTVWSIYTGRPTFEIRSPYSDSIIKTSEGAGAVADIIREHEGRNVRTNGPGAPSMFNNMSDALQGNVGRRNSGSPFAVNDRVTMRAGHHTGMGSPDGTVTHPGSSRSLVRFDDGTLVDVENRALVPLRRNLGDGPPPPPPVGNPHGWATLTLDNAYDNAPLRSKEHPEWGEKRLRYEGSEGRGYWTHWSNHGSAVLPEGEFRFWEIKGGSEGSRGKGYAHRYPRARANPLRRNHHLHPGDRVSMGAFIGTVDQQLPGTYDTYQVHWDRGGMDRVEGHKLRKVARNPGFGDYFRAGKKTAAEIGGHVAQAPSELVGEAQKGLAKLHTGLKEMGARAKAAAEREAASRKCDAPTPAEAIRVLAKAHGVKVNPNLGPHGYRRNLGDGPPPPPPLPFRENRGRWRRNLGDGPPPPPPVGNPSYLFTMPAGGVSTRPTRRNMGEGSFPAPFTRLPRGHYRSNPASQREPTDPFIDVTVAEGRVRAYDPRDKNKWFNFYVTNSSGAEARYALHSGHGRNATPYWGSNDTPPSWVLRVLKQNNFDWREA